MTDRIPVFYETMRVGTINPASATSAFVYDDDWLETRGAFPVSLTVPLGRAPVSASVILTWLSNLLPEGGALEALSRRFGASRDDVLGILTMIGGDTAGGLSIGRPRAPEKPAYRPIAGANGLARLIMDLSSRPFLAGEPGISMSLAGVQRKLPVVLDEHGLSLPLNGAPSTHIIKPDVSSLYGAVQNEALCMVLARRAGLQVADVTTGIAGDIPYLLVARYDRIHRAPGWHRLHQEDFCQALGVPPALKYQRHQSGRRGPGLADLIGVTRRHMTARDVASLIDAVIFNVLVANVDSHAKNYSIMLRAGGASFAPLYDLMCGDAWPGITQNLPQDIGGRRRVRLLHEMHWRRMAEECGLNGTAVAHRVRALAVAISAEAPSAAAEVAAMPAGRHAMLEEFVQAIHRRCKLVLNNLDAAHTDRIHPAGATAAGDLPLPCV